MERNSICHAIVLHARPIGEMHAQLRLLTDRHGLISAAAYGARSKQGKLRSVARPFCNGKCWLYTTKGHHSIKDFSVADWFAGIPTSIDKYWAASVWMEAVLYSYGGGDHSDAMYRLLIDALRQLERGSAGEEKAITARFLWCYIIANGVQPDLVHCHTCHRPVPDHERRAYRNAHFFCLNCMDTNMVIISAAAIETMKNFVEAFHAHNDICEVHQRYRFGSHEAAQECIHAACHIIETMIGRPLNSVKFAPLS